MWRSPTQQAILTIALNFSQYCNYMILRDNFLKMGNTVSIQGGSPC